MKIIAEIHKKEMKETQQRSIKFKDGTLRK